MPGRTETKGSVHDKQQIVLEIAAADDACRAVRGHVGLLSRLPREAKSLSLRGGERGRHRHPHPDPSSLFALDRQPCLKISGRGLVEDQKHRGGEAGKVQLHRCPGWAMFRAIPSFWL